MQKRSGLPGRFFLVILMTCVATTTDHVVDEELKSFRRHARDYGT